MILWLVALFFESCRVLVTRGPKENRNRPSVDALFRSAAYNHGSKVIGIVLSGALVDGTSGLWSIKRMGGVTIAQDPGKRANSLIDEAEKDGRPYNLNSQSAIPP